MLAVMDAVLTRTRTAALAVAALAAVLGGCSADSGGGSQPAAPLAVFEGPSGSVEGLFPAEFFSGSYELVGEGYEFEIKPVHVDALPDWTAEEEGGAEGHFTLELRDAAGAALRRVPFDAAQHYVNNDGSEDGFFVFWLHRPPVYDSYAIYRDGQEQLVVQRSAHAPTAVISGVSEGQVFAYDDTIELGVELHDEDGDELVYQLYYSTGIDNGYERLGSRLRTDRAVSLATSGLKGSKQARFAVSVSDGTRAVLVESPAFQIPYQTPEVDIKAPRDGYRFTGFRRVTLEAWIQDKDHFADDFGTHGTVVWSSNIDGVIEPESVNDSGTVQKIQFSTRLLSEGHHTLTVTATDTTGLVGTDSAPMFVQHESYVPPPPPPQFRAQDDYAETQVGETIDIDVAVNDVAEEGYNYIQVNTPPELGDAEAVQLDNGFYYIRYTALAAGRDEFTYDICTGDHDCRTATVFVTVDPAG